MFSLSNLSPLDVCSLWKIYAHREDLPLGSGDMTRLIFTQTMNQEDLNHSEKIDAMWDLLCDLGTRHRKVVLSVSRNFDWIQRHKSTTKMTSKTLAMCFWPRGTFVLKSLLQNHSNTHDTQGAISSHSLPIPIRIIACTPRFPCCFC